jgi:K+-sensing histidine kinase KdpD
MSAASDQSMLRLSLLRAGQQLVKMNEPIRTILAFAIERLYVAWIRIAGTDSRRNFWRSFFGMVLAVVSVAIATLIIPFARNVLAVLNLVTIVYLVPVVTVAVWGGIWPAMLAAVLGAMAADYLFYPPVYSFQIDDPQNIADLIVYLIVGLVIGNLAGDVRERERHIRDLYGYSKQLAACSTSDDLIQATRNYLAKWLDRPTILVEGNDLANMPAADFGFPDGVRRRAMEMISGNTATAQTVYDDTTHHAWLVRHVSLGSTEYVVFVDLGPGLLKSKWALNRRIDVTLTEAAENLARLDLARAIDRTRLQAQADTLKTALVTTMSHDLRNPLVSILGAASVLDQMTGVKGDARARLLVSTIQDQAARLDSDLQNLTEAARLTTGVKRPDRQLTDPVDMIQAAIEQRHSQLAAHRVEVTIASDVPLIEVQSVLVENALAQLLDNAAKYSPQGSVIKIEGNVDQDWFQLSVSDRGVGLTAEEQQRVGRWSFRSERHAATIPGSGLGLWIAATFIAANGGRLSASSAGPGLGTKMTIYLPIDAGAKTASRTASA